jgi:hypothetical protein
MLTWSPYAFVTLYSSFVNPDHITPVGSTLPAIFAKSSTVWSTIFYIFSNKNIKSKMSFKRSSTDRVPTIHRQILQKICFNFSLKA